MSRRRSTSESRIPTSTPGTGIDHLVVTRESAEYDGLLMLGMIQQTLTKVRHLPGAVELLEAGMAVFDDPKRWGALIKRVARSRMALVERDGVLYIYSQGSAARDDLEDGNSFIQELTGLLEKYQPRETWVASVTRLLRSVNYLSVILESLESHTQFLHGEMEINLRTPQGRMMFGMLALFAASERDYIVQRHTTGRVAQHQRGDWIPSWYPPGYAKIDRRLVLVDDEVDKVRHMLRVLADRSLSSREVVRRLGGIGVSTARLRKLYGDGATMADARNPSDIVATLIGWMGMYQTGVYETLWPNPFAGLDEFAGVKVEHVEGFRYGALRFSVRVPLPDGGWADDETFESIRGRVVARPVTGGASHDTAPPLSGLFQFVEDDHEYSIAAGNGTYALLRRPHEPQRAFVGWQPENVEVNDVEVLGRVDRVTWHRSLAEAILHRVEEGLPAHLDTQRFSVLGDSVPLDPVRAELRARRRELDEVKAALKRARRNARLAEGDELATDFVNEAISLRRDAERLGREIARLENADKIPSLGEAFESSAEMAAYALAALAESGNREAAGLRQSLRALVTDERWHLEGRTLHWNLTLELPHEQGTVVLGPITGSVDAKPAQRSGPTHKSQRRSTKEALIRAGLGERAARAAAACPSPLLSRVLLSHLSGQPLPRDAERGWAEQIIATYCDPNFSWSRDHWRLPDETRQPALDVLKDCGDGLNRSEMLAAGVTATQLRYLSKVTPAPSGAPILRTTRQGRGVAYSALKCPHCGGRSLHSIVTPETRPGVLCITCWRAPFPGSPVFPEWYQRRQHL